VLIWFTEHKLETAFGEFTPGRRVAYPFYSEWLSFALVEVNGGTDVNISHRCGADAAIHVAQSWGFLKANLKVWIEHGIDLRERIMMPGSKCAVARCNAGSVTK